MHRAEHKSWHSRGYLPRFDAPGIIQFISYRLYDAVPAPVLESWKLELSWKEGLSSDDPQVVELRKRIAVYEDAGRGSCWSRRLDIGALVEGAFLHFDAERYSLIAWCVMPNHVHVMIEEYPDHPLDQVVYAWKSFTAHEANKILQRKGQFWMEDYFDRFMRDEEHYRYTQRYIEDNPVKASLVRRPEDWRWSSAFQSR